MRLLVLFMTLLMSSSARADARLSLQQEIDFIQEKIRSEPQKAEHHLLLGQRLAKRQQGDDLVLAKKEYERFLELADRRDLNIPRVKEILQEAENQALVGVKAVQVWTIDELLSLVKFEPKNPDHHMRLGSLYAKKATAERSAEYMDKGRRHYGLFMKYAKKTHPKYQEVKRIVDEFDANSK